MIFVQSVPHWKIDGNHVGPIYIGMTVSQLKKEAHKLHFRIQRTSMTTEGQTLHGYSLVAGKSLLMKGYVSDKRLYMIDVYDRRFSTLAGIHAESPIRDALKAYGPGNLDGSDNTVTLSFDKKLKNIYFVVDDVGDLPGNVTLKDVPKTSPRIEYVSITK